MEYIVVVEQAQDGSYSAFVPDLPGCVSCGDTIEEVREMIGQAIAIHIASLREHGEPVPSPTARTFAIKAA